MADSATTGPLNPKETKTEVEKGPLKTVFIDSIGPFLAEFVGASFSIIDTYWISKSVGDDGMAAVSVSSLMDTIARSFGFFISVSISSHFSYLRGKGNSEAIPRVFFDLFRLVFIFAILVPAALIPLVKPMLRWFGASGAILQGGFEYLAVLIGGSLIICLNHLFCGCLQAEKRMTTYGIIQVSIFLMDMFVFDPLYLMVFDLGLKGAALATITSEFIPMAIMAFYYLGGKMETKMEWRNIFSKFDKEAYPAMKIGLTQFLSRLFFNIPSFFSRKYVGNLASATGQYSEVMAAWNVVLRVWYFPASYATALSIGFLPSASFSYGAQDYHRMILLLVWSYVLAFAWCSGAELILIFLASPIARIFSSVATFVEKTKSYMIITYFMAFTMGFQFITGSLLQSMKRATASIVCSFLTQFVPVPLFGSILYFTDKGKNDVSRLMWMYPLNDGFAFLVCLVMIISPLIELRKKSPAAGGVSPTPLLESSANK